MTLEKQLERFGKAAAAGWGDVIFPQVLATYLAKANPDRLQEYIKNNTRLLDTISEKRQRLLRRMGKAMAIKTVTTKEILELLRKENPAIATILAFQPGGQEWLENQIVDIKKTLLT